MKLIFARGPQLGLRLFLLTILSITLMILDHREHYLAPVRAGLDTLIAPIQYIVNTPATLVSTMSANLATRRRLLEENTGLRSQQLLLQVKLQRLLTLEKENNELRVLLKSSPKVQNEKTIISQLLAVSSDPLMSELILDKGSRQGVYEGQPVLDASGIVGQVIQVGPLTSRVLLITDLRSAVPVQDTRNGVRGIILGQGSLAKLILTNIPETVDVRPGDVLVSSGLGGHYPEGYPIGTVSVIHHNSGEQFTKINVLPCAKLDRSRDFVLLWPPRLPIIDVPRPLNGKVVTKISGGKKR